MEAVRAPYLTRPTLRGSGVRDTSLTDFEGHFLLAFFFPSDWEHQQDLLQLNKHMKQLRKAGCEVVVISPDSCLVHKTWAHAPTEDGGLGGIHFPMMEDTRGELASQLNIWDEEEGVCVRSILILDDKSVIRHLATSSLPMDDLIDSASLTLDLLREAGPVVVGEQGRKSSFLDKLWRTSLKLPATPQTSLKRSISREVRRGGEEGGAEVAKRRGRSRSKSRSRKEPRPPTPTSLGEERSNQVADELIDAVKKGLGSRLACSLPLPDYSAGEVCLGRGRIQGLGRLGRGGGAEIQPRAGNLIISIPLQVTGVRASYNLSGRRLEGELSFAYHTLTYRARLTQPIGAEVEGNLKLLELQLENVEGGKMEVHGFGPLNWLAGRKVSDLVQETLLQEVEQELRQGLEDQLDQLAIYFQAVEKESPGLVPIGLLVH